MLKKLILLNFEKPQIPNGSLIINIKEAREGINGKCLPKDTLIIDEFFRNNKFIKMAIKIDKQYKKILKNSKGKKL